MNIWEEFLDGNSDIKKKLNGLPLADPAETLVDSAIKQWTSRPRDAPFEFTPERRQLLIKMVKLAVKHRPISESPFYQYLRAYELHLYHWLVEFDKQQAENEVIDNIRWMWIFEQIIANAFVMGYCLKKLEPRKKKRPKA